MKYFKLFSFIILSSFIGFTGIAQDLNPPKDGAVVRLSNTKLEVTIDKELSNDVWLVKSKRYEKRNFGGLQAKAPAGVTISFEPKDEIKNVFTMKIKLDAEAKPGKYMVVIKGSGENAHKVKSSLISLVVAEGTLAGNGKQ